VSAPTLLSRRRLLQASAPILLTAPGARALAAPVLATAGPKSPLEVAKAALGRLGDRVPQRDIVGVADFSLPSRTPRLHLVDLAGGAVETLLVAHGRGSDPGRTGWLSRFSNAPGSDCTSEGAFLTADEYVGAHGRSLRLAGLDTSNSNAQARAIVIHAAWYVGPDIVRSQGMLGRSEGCFAVSEADLTRVLRQLAPGRLLVSAKV